MKRTPVSSSNLREVGYDAASQTLEIEFHSGGVYQYYGVSPDVYEGLMSAGSHGRYFYYQIRGAYPYSRIR
jgi:hypothetical protein